MHPQTISGRVARTAAFIALALIAVFILIALTGIIDLDRRDSLVEDLAAGAPMFVMFASGVVAAVSGIWSLIRRGERAWIVYAASTIGVMFSILLLIELVLPE